MTLKGSLSWGQEGKTTTHQDLFIVFKPGIQTGSSLGPVGLSPHGPSPCPLTRQGSPRGRQVPWPKEAPQGPASPGAQASLGRAPCPGLALRGLQLEGGTPSPVSRFMLYLVQEGSLSSCTFIKNRSYTVYIKSPDGRNV